MYFYFVIWCFCGFRNQDHSLLEWIFSHSLLKGEIELRLFRIGPLIRQPAEECKHHKKNDGQGRCHGEYLNRIELTASDHQVP